MRTKVTTICAIMLLAHVPAIGQTLSAVEFSIEEGGVFTPITGTGAITFQAQAVDVPVTARMRIRNVSPATITVTQVLLQGARFTLAGLAPIPAELPTNAALDFRVTYSPASSSRAVAQISVTYTGAGVPAGAGFAIQPLAGTAPQFRFAYVTSEANTLPMENGGTLSFPTTQVNSSSVVTVVIANVGTAPGVVNSAAVAGSPAYRLQALPLFPAALEPAREFRFNLRFTPTQAGTSPGSLRVGLSSGDVSFTLDGAATSSSFSYELLLPDSTRAFTPGSTIVLPETALGSTTNAAIRVMNTGTGDGLITAISLVGSAFRLAETPLLPASLPAQNSIVFGVNFTPAEPGSAIGRLRIGNDNFDISAVGAGSRLVLSQTVSDATVTLPPSGTVIFSPTQVGRAATIDLVLENKGNRPANLANVSIAQTGTGFTLTGLPGLPVQLQPNQSLAFAIRFSPPTLGQFSGSLRVNTDTFNVTGSATQPPTLPGYTFTGPSGAVEQMLQPSVGLTLNSPYELPLRGVLTIGFESDTFAVDPAVQFATGGRTVSFTIQPGSREAVFSNGATSVRLQTGTVSGAIVITTQFSTADLEVTPVAPAALRLTIAPSAPRLLNVQIGALTPSGVTFVVTGTATTRTLQSIEVVLNVSSTSNVSVTGSKLTIDVAALAEAYYRSGASLPFGSVIQASVPIAMHSSATGVPSLADIFDAATITLVNAVGRSNSVSVALR